MKKRLYIIILLTFVLVCSTMTLGLAADKIVLDFPSWQATEPGFSDWYKEVIDEFESEHPNVEINFYPIPFTDYLSTLTLKFAAGDPPDIFVAPKGSVPGIIDMGWLQPIDSRLEGTDILASYNPMQNVLKQEGNWYGVMLLAYGDILFYNEKMLEEAGVSVPTTLEEFYEAAKKLTVDKDGDGNIDQYGFAMETASTPDVYVRAMSFITGYGGAFAKDGELTIKDPAVVKGLNLIDKLTEEKLVPMGLIGAQKRSYFFEGKVAMIIDGPWSLAMKDVSDPEVAKHIKVALPPTNTGNISGGMSNSIHIPKGISKEKEELVWQFIYKCSRPKWQVRYMELTKCPAARTDVLTEELLNNVPEMKTFLNASQIAVDLMPSGYVTQYALFNRIVTNSIMKIMTTDESVESVLDKLEQELKSELE